MERCARCPQLGEPRLRVEDDLADSVADANHAAIGCGAQSCFATGSQMTIKCVTHRGAAGDDGQHACGKAGDACVDANRIGDDSLPRFYGVAKPCGLPLKPRFDSTHFRRDRPGNDLSRPLGATPTLEILQLFDGVAHARRDGMARASAIQVPTILRA